MTKILFLEVANVSILVLQINLGGPNQALPV